MMDKESKRAVAERLVRLRAALGFTQTIAAERIGESQATWGFWESPNNERQPTAQQLATIERITGAPREWVQSGIDERMPISLLRKLANSGR